MSVAVEWAPKVRVNCVTVGLIVTEGGDEHYGGPEGMARVAATIPLGRMGTPSDVGDVVLFLASPLASYITGSKVLMHGGGERPAFLDAPTRHAKKRPPEGGLSHCRSAKAQPSICSSSRPLVSYTYFSTKNTDRNAATV